MYKLQDIELRNEIKICIENRKKLWGSMQTKTLNINCKSNFSQFKAYNTLLKRF